MQGTRRNKRMPVIVALVVALVLALSTVGLALAPEKMATGRHGAVAAAHPLAAEAGIQMLKAGGNAVDAAVASAFAVGVVEPQASGVGGEGMMVIYLAKQHEATVVDYKSEVPKGAEGIERAPKTGYGSVGIPGTVAGLCLALEKYGTLPLWKVIEPAIELADKGFPCGETLAGVITDNYEKILASEDLSRVFLNDGLPIQAGEIIRNPDYANVLRSIAVHGPAAVYAGQYAKAITDEVQANGGFLSMEDLAQYKAVIRKPIQNTYRGYTVITTPPPVTSVAMLEALNVMQNFDLPSMSNTSAENIHVISEAIRQGNIDRQAYVGDPDFIKVPVQEMLSPEYAKSIASRISFTSVIPGKSLKPGVFAPATSMLATGTDHYLSPSTTHISTVDKNHNMVALTQTLSSFFGAGVMIKGTGIMLNNEMANVYGAPTAPAGPQAYKRIITTISPTIMLKKGKPFVSIGTPGATRIMTTMAILISNIADHNLTLEQAINAPRFHPSYTNQDLEYEGRMPADVVEKLKAMGYVTRPYPEYDLYFGGAQGVMIGPWGKLIGAADPRRDGAASAY